MDDTSVQPKHEPSIFDDTDETSPRLPIAGQLMVVGVLLLAIFGTGFVPKIVAYLQGTETQTATIPLRQTTPEAPAPFKETTPANPFMDVNISAQAVFVWDSQQQRVLYEKNPDEQLPLASVTKLMTALLAYEILETTEDITIPADAIQQDGESGFLPGETFTLEALTDLTLMSSSNDGAYAIAAAAGAELDAADPAAVFVQAMNIRADELGLSQTYFRNPTGLDLTEDEAGAYGSARDIAFLLEYIVKNQPGLIERTTDAYGSFYNETGAYHNADNTNQFVYDIPGLIGSKTGYTTLAGGNLAIAFDASLNRPIMVVVLGSSYQGRFNDVLTLTEAARTAVQK